MNDRMKGGHDDDDDDDDDAIMCVTLCNGSNCATDRGGRLDHRRRLDYVKSAIILQRENR